MKKQRRFYTPLLLCIALLIGGVVTLEISSQELAVAQSLPTQSSTPLTIEQAGTSSSKQERYELKDLIEMYSTPLSIVVPALGGIFAYWMNESWKRRQYIECKIKEFECKPETINVRKLLSNELQCIELFPFVEPPTHRYVIVEDCLWAEALLECKCNETLRAEFSRINKDEELYLQNAAVKSSIRDNFNGFLGHLQHFEKMIEAGAIDKKKLEPYINPWIKYILKASNNVSLRCSIDNSNYTPREALLAYMGLKQDVSEESLSVVQKDIRSLFSRYIDIASWKSQKHALSTTKTAEERCPQPTTT